MDAVFMQLFTWLNASSICAVSLFQDGFYFTAKGGEPNVQPAALWINL